MDEYWSYILTAIGLAGFFLAGKRVWWAWYINIANQGLWLAYALVSHQLGFLIGVVAYSVVFTKNAISWTKDHYDKTPKFNKQIGQVDSIILNDGGMFIGGRIYPENGDIFATDLTGFSMGSDGLVPIIDRRGVNNAGTTPM